MNRRHSLLAALLAAAASLSAPAVSGPASQRQERISAKYEIDVSGVPSRSLASLSTASVLEVQSVVRSAVDHISHPDEAAAVVARALQSAFPGRVTALELPLYYTRKWCEDIQEFKITCCNQLELQVGLESNVRVRVSLIVTLNTPV